MANKKTYVNPFSIYIWDLITIILMLILSRNQFNESVTLILILLLYVSAFGCRILMIKSVICIMFLFSILSILYSISYSDFLGELNIVAIALLAVVFLILVILQMVALIHSICNKKPEKSPNVKNSKKIIALTVKIINVTDTLICKLVLLIPIALYFIVVLALTLIFANIYSITNRYYNNGITTFGYYSKEANFQYEHDFASSIYEHNANFVNDEIDSIIRIPAIYVEQGFIKNTVKTLMSEYMYFSMATFSVGAYGDVLLQGAVPKLLVQIEMFVLLLINLILVPLIIYSFQKFFDNKRNCEENDDSSRIINKPNIIESTRNKKSVSFDKEKMKCKLDNYKIIISVLFIVRYGFLRK